MGGASCKCWLCRDPNGIVEEKEVGSTSRWQAVLRSISPTTWTGNYEHAACRILNGIAKRTKTTLHALPPEPRVKPKLLQLSTPSNGHSGMRPPAFLRGNIAPRPQG